MQHPKLIVHDLNTGAQTQCDALEDPGLLAREGLHVADAKLIEMIKAVAGSTYLRPLYRELIATHTALAPVRAHLHAIREEEAK